MARHVTAPTTITPPSSASGLGRSPMKSITHTGLRIGSMTGISAASSAVTCRMARA